MTGASQQLRLQPSGELKGSVEFGPYTPQVFTEISPDQRVSFRRFIGEVASEVDVEYCSEEDKLNSLPSNILDGLLIPAVDPRRKKNTDPEQLIVVGRDMELPTYSENDDENTFYYPGSIGVVFDEKDFKKVARAPTDLAKVMKAQNRVSNSGSELIVNDEEQLEIINEENDFKAIRAAIHTLDQYIVNMSDLASFLSYKRHLWSRIHRFMSFPTFAQYKGRDVHKIWGEADSEIHKLADLSKLNATKEFYESAGMHRSIKNNLYNSDLRPVDSFRVYISKLIKPYTRAKFEKVKTASMAAAEVRNRHMDMLPASMQGQIISDEPDAYEVSIVPRIIEDVIEEPA